MSGVPGAGSLIRNVRRDSMSVAAFQTVFTSRTQSEADVSEKPGEPDTGVPDGDLQSGS
jgi:hypothetical protein